MIPRELFAEHVQDALESYYDAVRLQANPLLELLPPSAHPDQNKITTLRHLLREAIESLRPPATISFGRPEYLGYRLLWLRYIQSRNQQTVCDELALSRTSYYRRLSEALDAIVAVLWEKLVQQPQEFSAPDASGDPAVASHEAIERVGQLARQSQRQMVNPSVVLEHVWEVIAPMQDRLGITVQLSAPARLPAIYGDPAILRQILLGLLTEAMGLAGAKGLELTVNPKEEEMLWCLHGLDAARMAGRELEHLSGFAVSRALLSAYQGRLWLTETVPGTPILCFCVPVPPTTTLLIVDDDPDAGDLYRRYLQTEPYIIQIAHSADEMARMLAESRPDLILLDVIMPQEDGWDILQRLKTQPATADIPVLVCSVLSQPALALMLGAAQVLQKPIEPHALLQAIRDSLRGDIAD